MDGSAVVVGAFEGEAGVVGAMEGLAVYGDLVGDSVVASAMVVGHVSTEQKGPDDVVGVVGKLHPELVKMPVLEM